MDEALVEDAQDDVDDQDGHDQQEPQALRGGLEGLGGALKAGGDGGRQHLPGELFHLGHGIAQGTPGFRLKEMVTAGSCPRWLTVRGPRAWVRLARAFSGTSCPPVDRT